MKYIVVIIPALIISTILYLSLNTTSTYDKIIINHSENLDSLDTAKLPSSEKLYRKVGGLYKGIKSRDEMFLTSILVGVQLTTILVLLIILIRDKEKKKRSELLHELNIEKQKSLSLQMNPHFLFNTLGSIQYYVLNNDRIKSDEYITKFADLMRMILDNWKYDQIKIEEELKTLDLYIELEKLRLGDKFNYSIDVESSDKILEQKIPGFLLQPFVENAIWHGITHKESTGNLEITLKLKNENIIITIDDDGIGRKKAREIKNKKYPNKESIGNDTTLKRIELFNQIFKKDIKVKFTDKINENSVSCGTRVEIFIPIDNEI